MRATSQLHVITHLGLTGASALSAEIRDAVEPSVTQLLRNLTDIELGLLAVDDNFLTKAHATWI